MDEKLKEDWVKALRSGEYDQAASALKYREGEEETASYCCLGVLCEVHPEIQFNEILGEYYKSVETEDGGCVYQEIGDEVLVGWFMREIGLSSEDADYLMSMNDSQGKDFLQIADHIEENL